MNSINKRYLLTVSKIFK